MGDMTRALTYPPCPTCEAEVVHVNEEGGAEDRRFGSRDTHVVAAAKRFELVPCGHEVRTYTIAHDGAVTWGAA